MKVKKTTSEERVQTEILWEDAKLHSLKIFTEIFVTFASRFSKIMEVKVLKLSSSFYFLDFDQFKLNLGDKSLPKSKIFWSLNPVALNVQCKTFQFFKAGKIVSKFIFYY